MLPIYSGGMEQMFFVLWLGKNIKVDGKCICYEELSIYGLNIVWNLFEINRNIKPCVHSLESNKIQWMQLINALSTSWKKPIKEEKANLITLSIYDHYLIKNNQFFSFNELSSRVLYNMQIIKNNENLLLSPTTSLFSVRKS